MKQVTTTTLFSVVRSELQKMGLNEFEGSKPATSVFPFGDFLYYDAESQFTQKILNFDYEVQTIMGWLFHGHSLDYENYDYHFKKMFLLRFANRQINFQTIESFKFKLVSTFMVYEDYLNRLYLDAEKYIEQQATSLGKNSGSNKQNTTTDSITQNRQAFADTPQDEVNLNLDSDRMTYATDNTVSKNKENANSLSDTITKNDSNVINHTYSLDSLIKSSSLFENIMKHFDQDCFLQIW